MTTAAGDALSHVLVMTILEGRFAAIAAAAKPVSRSRKRLPVGDQVDVRSLP
jgi:hypothetical protein